MMRTIKNIYRELVLIRRELQAIRRCLESEEKVYMVREPYSRNYKLVKAGCDGSLDAK